MAKKFAYPLTFPAAPSGDTAGFKLKQSYVPAEGGDPVEFPVTDHPGATPAEVLSEKFPENATVSISVAAYDDAVPANVGAFGAPNTFPATDTVSPGEPGMVGVGPAIQYDE